MGAESLADMRTPALALPTAQAPIGVFDSGLGGLSILKEVQRQLPQEHLIYVADSGHAPYGEKPTQTIVQRSQQVLAFLQTQGVKAVVVACNTATVHAAAVLRENLNIPLVGVEPAVKPAALLTAQTPAQQGQAKHQARHTVVVWVTEATARSARLQALIDSYGQGANIVVQACPGLVECVETGDFDSPHLHQLLRQYLLRAQASNANALVLGCTHYPLLLPAIQSEMARLWGETGQTLPHIVETSSAVTQQLQRLLHNANALACNASRQPVPQAPESVQFFSSKAHDAQHVNSLQRIWGKAVTVQALPAQFS